MLLTGCAELPYRNGSAADYHNSVPLRKGEAQISQGKPDRLMDAAGWYWPGSLVSKLVLWNTHVDSHEISKETTDILREYLRQNNLTDVKVRLNDYDADGELERTRRNKAVAAGWRYTFGALAWLQYKILPGRIFGGDNYNPYSNTINLYSDIPAVALHEAGHAKDFGRRKHKGNYAFAYIIPFFNMYPEALATRDALGYLRTYGSLQEQQAGYNILYPAYGTYIGGGVGDWLTFPWNYVAMAGGVIPGHIAGRGRAATLAPAPPHHP